MNARKTNLPLPKSDAICAPTHDPKENAYAVINANRQVELDTVDSLQLIAPDLVSEREIEALRRIKNEKYERRLLLYDAGEPQWDTNLSLTMVLRGSKSG